MTVSRTTRKYVKPLIILVTTLPIVFLVKLLFFYPAPPKAFTYAGAWRHSSICSEKLQNSKRVTISGDLFDLTLYTHSPENDLISKTLHNAKLISDIYSLNLIHEYLYVFNDIDYVIDIGAHIGTLTVLSALMGKRVIAVDADEENLKALCTSVKYSNVQKQVAVIHNVLGFSHMPVTWAYQTNGNHTGSHVDRNDDTWIQKNSGWTFDARIPALVDNLIHMIPNITNSNILMIVDVNGYEDLVLFGAQLFMKKANIRGVLVNFERHKTKRSGREIKQMMQSLDLHPFAYQDKTASNIEDQKVEDWPNIVMWF